MAIRTQDLEFHRPPTQEELFEREVQAVEKAIDKEISSVSGPLLYGRSFIAAWHNTISARVRNKIWELYSNAGWSSVEFKLVRDALTGKETTFITLVKEEE
jgi:hypothetical protein